MIALRVSYRQRSLLLQLLCSWVSFVGGHERRRVLVVGIAWRDGVELLVLQQTWCRENSSPRRLCDEGWLMETIIITPSAATFVAVYTLSEKPII